MTHMEKLLSIAGPSILHSPPMGLGWAPRSNLSSALVDMLAQKNGFYAFESALHIFCDGDPVGERGLQTWNSNALWRGRYEDADPSALFFAEDVFGVQFCLVDGSISTFDPETGEIETMAADLEEWAAIILEDYRVLTGYPIAHEWQCANGGLPPGHRLIPKTPFVLGGEVALSNVHLLEAVKGMHLRASIARQIRDLPDGTSIDLTVED